MALVEMVMPKMGESIMEGTILTWLKKVGDPIEQDESVLEVATDKVDTEVPATHAGVLKEVLAKEGDVIPVGQAIAIIATETDDNGTSTDLVQQEVKIQKAVEERQELRATSGIIVPGSAVPAWSPSGKFYSPLVRNIAREENVSLTELETMKGTGKENRITKRDLLNYINNRPGGVMEIEETGHAATGGMAMSVNGEDDIIEMDRMRKIIAERMITSRQISAHVTSFVEADLTSLVNWRNTYKFSYLEREGAGLTFTPVFIEAVVKAILDFPMINISVEGTRIIRKKNVNIGMAVALPGGNLIVPVIHNADGYKLGGLVKKVNDLAKRARDNKLQPDELTGGTYTISNVGSFGNVMGTPIIVQPQVAILAFGAIVKKPAVVTTDSGDAIAIRSKMFLSHSYDHRVVDGALGGMFVRRVADYLEKFDISQGL
ncbi:MAG: dihydrolipoamide acetyltransferase family protein [Bacteroidetes bacterium]|nr:dihydrolipoamide acetyltransferase family protein [Bacteroidota bacterium]MDA1122154.1 dihydrolipoamide acetyltransferase family protein [Bacteroidota bacterium]